jgi:uncharacterized metal-binding protein YceD (DUF177 family)
VRGRIDADVVQSCVVSLAPVPAQVTEEFEAFFTQNPERAALSEEITFAPDEQDPPELIEDGTIDLGELAAQHLSLALDPFPRAAGAEIPAAYGGGAVDAAIDAADGGAGEEGRYHPFADLQARLKA